jgi:hypothetical protein
MAKHLYVLARSALSGYRKAQGGRTAWLEGTFTLARALRSARKQLPADRAFAAWLVKAGLRGLAKDDRAALLTIAMREGSFEADAVARRQLDDG